MYKILGLVISLSILFYSCSKNDKEYLSEIKKDYQDKNYTMVIEKVSEMKEKFPTQLSTLEALQLLLSVYQNNFVEPKNDIENSKKAIEVLLDINKLFPKEKMGSQSLFMAAFLTAEKLKDFKTAGELYNKFIQQYPDNSLVPSAKDEITNLGKSPEDILKEMK